MHIKRTIYVERESPESFVARDSNGDFLFEIPTKEFDNDQDLNRKRIEHEFRVWIEDKMSYDETQRNYFLNSKLAFAGNGFLNTFYEEYCHWLMLRATSFGTVVEAVSWRKQLKEMQLLKYLHRYTALPCELGLNESRRLNENYERIVNEINYLVGNIGISSTLEEIVKHHYFTTFYYPSAVAPIIEPATWALMEPEEKCIKRLDDYFYTEDVRNNALEVLKLVCNRLNNGMSKSDIIKAAKKALSPPLDELTGHSTESSLMELQHCLIVRFKKALLDPNQVTTGIVADSRFATAIMYAIGEYIVDEKQIPRYAIDRGLARMIANILAEQPNVAKESNYILKIITGSAFRKSEQLPAIIVNAVLLGKPYRMRDDPLVFLDSKHDRIQFLDAVTITLNGKQRTLNRIDDFVGDLPSTISSALTILWFLDMIDANRQNERDKGATELISFGLDNLGYYDESAYDEKYLPTIKKLLSFKRSSCLSYDALLSGNMAYYSGFISFWLTYLKEIGPLALPLRAELGMWA